MMTRPFDLTRLVRVLHDETGLVFEAVLVGERQEKIRLWLQGVCVHEQTLPVRDELAVAEALPKHLHVDDAMLEERFFLTRFVTKDARDNHSRLQEAMGKNGLDAAHVGAFDDAAASLLDQMQLKSSAIFFSLSDTEVRAVLRSLQS